MRERITTILFLILAYCSSGNVYGQKVNYQQFDNIYLGAEASVISCFLQDSEGLIWVGSNKGLFSYDGYSTQQHFTYGERTNTRIYCGIKQITLIYIWEQITGFLFITIEQTNMSNRILISQRMSVPWYFREIHCG